MSSLNVNALITLIAGVIYMVIGLIFSGTIISIAATSGAVAQIGSFAGASNLNNIFPFLYYAFLIITSMAVMLAGAAGVLNRGPLKAR